MVAYTGIETISNMAEEARDYGKTIPRAMGGVVVAVVAIYAFLPAVALSAMPVENGETALARRSSPATRSSASSRTSTSARSSTPAEIYVGVLAATILFIATNAGLIGVSRLTYSMGQYRQLPEALRQLHPKFRTPYIAIAVFGVVACVTIMPGPGRLPRHDLRVRRDAVVHDRAPRGDHAAHEASPTASGRGAGPVNVTVAGATCPLFAVVGGVRHGLAWIVVTVLDVDDAGRRARSGSRSASRPTCSTGAAWASTLTRDASRSIVPEADRRARGRVRVRPRRVRGLALLAPTRCATAVKLAARRRRGIHVLVTITVPNSSPIDAPLPEQEALRAADDRLGARARAAGA